MTQANTSFFDIVKKNVYGENMQNFNSEIDWIPTSEELDNYKVQALLELIPMIDEEIVSSDLIENFDMYFEAFNYVPITRMIIRIILNTIDVNAVKSISFDEFNRRNRYCFEHFYQVFLSKLGENEGTIEIEIVKTDVSGVRNVYDINLGATSDEKFHNINKAVEKLERKFGGVYPYISNISDGKGWFFTDETDINEDGDSDIYEIYIK